MQNKDWLSRSLIINNTSGEDGTLTIHRVGAAAISFRYCYNGDCKWTYLTISANKTITLPANSSIYIQGDNKSTATNSTYWKIYANVAHTLSGLASGLIGGGREMSNQYAMMNLFNGDTALTDASELKMPTKLTNFCCSGMFNGCTALVKAPELPATSLVKQCYYRMFYSCGSLNYIKAMFTAAPVNKGSASNQTYQWVSGVASEGTFVMSSAATWSADDYTGVSGVPSGWAVATADS